MIKTAYVVPTRGRPKNAQRLLKAWKDTQAVADLYFVCDIDDWSFRDYQAIDGINIITNHITAQGASTPSDVGARALLNDARYDYYDYIGLMGDDTVPRTLFWDYRLQLLIPANKNGIAYGNDLLQEQQLPAGGALFSREIVKQLNGLALPGSKHLYTDNFWKRLGEDINGLFYDKTIIMEHMHPLAGKAAMDDHYARVNSEQYYQHDRAAYESYMASNEYQLLVERLRNA